MAFMNWNDLQPILGAPLVQIGGSAFGRLAGANRGTRPGADRCYQAIKEMAREPCADTDPARKAKRSVNQWNAPHDGGSLGDGALKSAKFRNGR
jgi:hypothetical protein